jgi:hypothetical protein
MVQVEASWQATKKVPSYCCHKCNSSNCLTIQRRRINNIHSIQSWSCNKCGFKWKETWSSYSKPVWSLQHHSMQRPKVMIHKIC